MEAPRLIKDGMRSVLDCSGGDINVADVAIRRRVTNKDASEVMCIKLRPSVSRFLDIYTRSECFKTFEVWTFAIPRLKMCLLCTTVATAVEQECGMHKSRGPVYSKEAGIIQEGSSDLCKGAIEPSTPLFWTAASGPVGSMM